jgi:hypothetical protein
VALCVVVSVAACAGGITDPFARPSLIDVTVTQGAAFIEPQPVGSDAEDLIACPMEIRLASLVDEVVTLSRIRLETRQATVAGERAEREWLEGRALTRWFDPRLDGLATDTARLGLAGPRPFDWELEIFFEAEGRRGEVSRVVSGRCGPPIPNEGAAPSVTVVEVLGGGPGAAPGDTIDVTYRVSAAAGVWSLQESTYFMTAIDTAPPRTLADGPTTVDRRRRYVLQDRGGVPLDWTLFVRVRDLRETRRLPGNPPSPRRIDGQNPKHRNTLTAGGDGRLPLSRPPRAVTIHGSTRPCS